MNVVTLRKDIPTISRHSHAFDVSWIEIAILRVEIFASREELQQSSTIVVNRDINVN